MKKWKMQFTPESARLLSKLHPENKKRIKKTLTELRQNPHPGKDLMDNNMWQRLINKNSSDRLPR